MNFKTLVKNTVLSFTGQKVKNDTTTGSSLANDFLRYGPNKPMYQNWSQVQMSDQDMYTGYSYAAITKRANRSTLIGKGFLFTEGSDAASDAAKKLGNELKHPYLPLISDSKEFTETDFWEEISTYLDLQGVYYLMAVRAVGAEKEDGTVKVGAVQKFILLNPYEVKRVIKAGTNELGGYLETRNGMYREIPKELIIEIRKLNPFNKDLPYAMTDAAKENQFALKQAGDYTRNSMQGNIQTPGIISTEVFLEPHLFENFVSRIQTHQKGEPLYGNGTGAIDWNSMQIDLDKAALDKINEIHRSMLFAVSGTSKTTLGIEESGTTRDTARTQKDNFTEDAIMPQVQKIIDALNLDYRKYYPEWEQNRYEILLDNPLESDRESELKDIEIRTKELELSNSLVAAGYEPDLAVKYAKGEISLDELGQPTLEPEITDEEAYAMAAKEAGATPEEYAALTGTQTQDTTNEQIGQD